MTSYSRRRSYPSSASSRERANAGTDTELFARKVALDLDQLDADWPKEARKSTVILGRSGTQTGLNANDVNVFVDFDTVVSATTGGVSGLYTGTSQTIFLETGVEGWVHIVASAQGQASGAVTASAHHRLELVVNDSSQPDSTKLERYYGHSQQFSTNTVFTNVEAFVYLNKQRYVGCNYYHTNTGSTVNLLVPGTRMAATMVLRTN